MRKSLPYAALIISLLVLFAGNATAARLHLRQSVCKEYQSASAVFMAYVTDVQKETGKTGYRGFETISMRIEESFKGVKESDIVFTQKRDFETCTPWFVKGERWLIYAVRDKETNVLYPIECGRSIRREFAGPDLRYLRALPAIANKTRLAGAVDHYGQGYGGLRYFKHLSGIKVTVKNQQGNRYETYTDVDGVYEFIDLPTGTYTVHADIPEYLKILDHNREDAEATLVEQACAEAHIGATSAGSVSGQVLDENGKTVPDLGITLVPMDEIIKPDRYDGAILQATDKDGKFGIKDLLPGSYFIGVNIIGEPSGRLPFPPTFYPGVASLSQAKKLVISEGEQITGLTLRLPAKLATRVIEGTAVYSNGQVISSGFLHFVDSNDPRAYDDPQAYKIYADGNIGQDGHFSIRVLQGTTGWIRSVGITNPQVSRRPYIEYIMPEKIEATEDIKNLKLVVPLPNDN